MEENLKSGTNLAEGAKTELEPSIKKYEALSDEKLEQIEDIKSNIKVMQISEVRTVGSEMQNSLNSGLSAIIEKCSALDYGNAGKALEDLSITAQTPLDTKVFGKRVSKLSLGFRRFTNKYKKVGDQLDSLVSIVEDEKDKLISALDDLNNLIEVSKQAYYSTDVYEYALTECIADLGAELAEVDNSTIEYLDKQRLLNTYRRRLETFSASRVVVYQTIKESMLLMITNQTLADDMQYGVDNIIPLWKAKLITAANVEMQKNSIELNKVMRDSFSKLIEDNAKNIADNVKTIQEMSSSSVIDIKALEGADKTLNNVIEKLRKDLFETGDTHDKVMGTLREMHNSQAEGLTGLIKG